MEMVRSALWSIPGNLHTIYVVGGISIHKAVPPSQIGLQAGCRRDSASSLQLASRHAHMEIQQRQTRISAVLQEAPTVEQLQGTAHGEELGG